MVLGLAIHHLGWVMLVKGSLLLLLRVHHGRVLCRWLGVDTVLVAMMEVLLLLHGGLRGAKVHLVRRGRMVREIVLVLICLGCDIVGRLILEGVCVMMMVVVLTGGALVIGILD